MTWTDRLKQFSGFGGEPTRPEVTALLPEMVTAVDRLKRAAELAPTPTLQHDLLPVIRYAEAVVQHVRDALRDFGAFPPATRRLPGQVDGHNHWARLLHALEQHREARQRLRELSISIEDTNPALSQVLAKIGQEQDLVVEQLRDLIALADPQALN